jgi:SAM-dependent methyltransferase
MLSCRACETTGDHRRFWAREMMLGTREPFEYFECRECGSVQIVEPPADLGRYYPQQAYYSFADRPRNSVVDWLDRHRLRHCFGQRDLIGALVAAVKPATLMAILYRFGMKPHQRVLDVGCGAGVDLHKLAKAGFRGLVGVDPFVKESVRHPDGVDIKKAVLEDVRGPFDVVMFHHSLEHILDPIAALRQARSLLAPAGLCIVRVPTVSSEAFREYGTDWVGLDAPRHIVIPSRTGFAIMARAAGLNIVESIDDSWSFGFLASELCRRNVSYGDLDGWSFSTKERDRAVQRAQAVNEAQRGDQVAVLLRPAAQCGHSFHSFERGCTQH